MNYHDDSHGPECAECGHYHDDRGGRCSLHVEGCECLERWIGDRKGWGDPFPTIEDARKERNAR